MLRLVSSALLAITVMGWQAQRPQTFRTSTDAVPVYVSVMGRDGLQIKGLQQSDFTLLDNGKPQPITYFSADRHPFALALLIDGRSSMMFGPGWARQAEFARLLADSLDKDDHVALGSVHGPLVQLSADKTEVSRQLRRPPLSLAGEFKRFEDEPSAANGFIWAGSMLSGYEGRRIVIFFTDGGVRLSSSPTAFFDYADPAQVALHVVKESERSDAAFHVIAFDDSTVTEEFLRAFAWTGGGASLIARYADMKKVAREFVDELHHEYFLSFAPSQQDGKSHKLDVKVNRPDVKVRARTSYLAPKK